jgi:three-Cys-motif partner protein
MGTYWQAKPHAQQKYNILGKYLAACGKFARKYQNFAYIDTHGGSGIVEMVDEGSEHPLFPDYSPERMVAGSPLIAARAIQAWSEGKAFPCHIIEIDSDRYATLEQSTQEFPWVRTHWGDCNNLGPDILQRMPSWAFVLCFVDPDGLVYDDPGGRGKVRQFTWKTIEQVTSREKIEILLNFPLEAIIRTAAVCQQKPDEPASQKMAEHLTAYFGCDDWWALQGKRRFLDLYLHRLELVEFPYRGAYYAGYKQQLPLYYLIYATRNEVGAKIMRDVMWGVWREYHLGGAQVKCPAWATLRQFVFDDEGAYRPEYPPNWEEIAWRVKEAAGWRCQECGHPHDPASHYVLTVHHRDGNTSNSAEDNLVALCQRCHLRAQAKLLQPMNQFQLSLWPNDTGQSRFGG